MTSWHEHTQKEIVETDRRVLAAVADGLTPTDAINREAHTTEAYSAMLKKYDLSPVIPD